MKVIIVVAMARNHVIGNRGQLPWQRELPADLQRFKALTMGHPIIMGRKTYQSIGRALPGRTNIVVTSQKEFSAPGCTIVTSLGLAFSTAMQSEGSTKICVIGGATLYRQALPFTTEINLTLIEHEFSGDTFFPGIGAYAWTKEILETHSPDDKNHYPYLFVRYHRPVKHAEVFTP